MRVQRRRAAMRTRRRIVGIGRERRRAASPRSRGRGLSSSSGVPTECVPRSLDVIDGPLDCDCCAWLTRAAALFAQSQSK